MQDNSSTVSYYKVWLGGLLAPDVQQHVLCWITGGANYLNNVHVDRERVGGAFRDVSAIVYVS